jgi:hypothetical protein
MTGSGQQPPVKRRKIIDQALQVLRETQAKIDPTLLALMKSKISDAGLAGPPARRGVFAEKTVETMSVKKPSPKTSAGQGAAAYASHAPRQPPISAASSEAEPVDRQKIAAIVMEYMRLREEKKPGH